MSTELQQQEVILRPARRRDALTVWKITLQVRNNPLSLGWRRFIVAQDGRGRIIGLGQVKVHADGSRELASIAVVPEWRGRGIARRIITQLVEAYPGRLYLTCQARLGEMYQKFGFDAIEEAEMPPYFRRISRMFKHFKGLFRGGNRLLVMRRG